MSAGRYGNEYGDEYDNGSAATADALQIGAVNAPESSFPGHQNRSAPIAQTVCAEPLILTWVKRTRVRTGLSVPRGTWKRRVENSATSKMQSKCRVR
jgi:hypothetical protein